MSKCPFADLSNPDLHIGGVPADLYRELREARVVRQDAPMKGGDPFWAFFRQEDIDQISKHPAQFSSAAKSAFLNDVPEDQLPLMRTMILNMDPPEHIKYRRIVRNAFTPAKVDSYEANFRKVVREAVDAVLARGECEFVTDIACVLPLAAICEILGVPIEDRTRFFEWTNTMLGADDPDLTTSEFDGQMAAAELYMYSDKLMALHREQPRDDIVGALLRGTVQGEHLTEDEFRSFMLLLIVAGNETTRTMTSQGMRLLLEHPEQYRMLVEDPALIPDAVEEILRFNPAVINFRRTATEDVELAGQQLAAGDKVVMFYQAASRDEALFENPDCFDITRPQREDVRNNHRAFGIGEHFCLGSHLARLQLRVVFEEIVRSIRNPRLNGDIKWLRSNFIHGIKEMPVVFDVVS
jgi:cholest-4-en-3-one 26-monooxygenase